MKGRILLLVSLLAMALWGNPAGAEDISVETRFAHIHCNGSELLEKFTKKIQPNALNQSINQIFLGSKGASPDRKAATYVDQVVQRVQMILDMHKAMPKIHVQIYQNQAELSDVYAGITGRPTTVPGFFWKEKDTVYLQVEGLTTGVLAHEMAHAVIGHYFIISPPEKIAELLSQYVDKEISKGGF